eukprot:scaffold544_cov66-Phaeocystis_antarctica.AAC.4
MGVRLQLAGEWLQLAGVGLQRRAQVAGSRVRRVAACCGVRRVAACGGRLARASYAGLLRGSPTRVSYTAAAAHSPRTGLCGCCARPLQPLLPHASRVGGGRAGGRAAHRHRQLLLVGDLLIVVLEVLPVRRLVRVRVRVRVRIRVRVRVRSRSSGDPYRRLASVRPAHTVLVDGRVDELAVVEADLAVRGLRRRGLWSAGRSAPVELLDDGAGLPAAAVALHARAHLEPQRGGGDVSLLDVHTAWRERSAQRAAHVGPAGVGVRRLECVGCSTSCDSASAATSRLAGRGGVLRLGGRRSTGLTRHRTPYAGRAEMGFCMWLSGCATESAAPCGRPSSGSSSYCIVLPRGLRLRGVVIEALALARLHGPCPLAGECERLDVESEALLPQVEARGVARLVQRHRRAQPATARVQAPTHPTTRVSQAVVDIIESVPQELPVQREEDGAVPEVEADAHGSIGPEARGVVGIALVATAKAAVLAPLGAIVRVQCVGGPLPAYVTRV